MKKFNTTIIVFAVMFLLTSCNSQNSDTEPSEPTETDTLEVETEEVIEEPLEVLDYAEIMLNSDDYDEVNVTVAGEIAQFQSGNSFYFRDRLGFDEAGIGFEVKLTQHFSNKESASDSYDIGEYVLVKGTWHSGRYASLQDAEILSVGDDAKIYTDTFMKQWYAKGESYSETLPITDYMDIVQNADVYDGQRVRTVGQIQAVGTNVATQAKYFSFRDRETNITDISFMLKGCPQEMQDSCTEGEYVAISGVVQGSASSRPSLSDCFVECVGSDAELLATQTEESWIQNYKAQRSEYISSCKNYSYEELARYPDKHNGDYIEISGNVLQIDTIWGENVVLLDIGQGNLVYVNYTGKQYRDPEILEDDTMTFYGECFGTKTYTTVLGSNNTVPYIVALYSSINQQQ